MAPIGKTTPIPPPPCSFTSEASEHCVAKASSVTEFAHPTRKSIPPRSLFHHPVHSQIILPSFEGQGHDSLEAPAQSFSAVYDLRNGVCPSHIHKVLPSSSHMVENLSTSFTRGRTLPAFLLAGRLERDLLFWIAFFSKFPFSLWISTVWAVPFPPGNFPKCWWLCARACGSNLGTDGPLCCKSVIARRNCTT